MLFKGSKINMR